MSVDERITRGLTMIEKELPEVDTVAGYEILERDIRRDVRRHRALMAAAAAVVLVAGLGLGAATLFARDKDHQTPGPSHPPSTAGIGSAPVCGVPRVTCLGNRTYRFDLVRPVEWRLPPGFQPDVGIGVSPLEVRAAPSHETHVAVGTGGDVGVRVLEGVRASSPNGAGPAPGVADNPRAFVSWVASRPFLHAGPVVRTELDRHPAWQVQVSLARGAGPGRKLCGGYPCHLLTYQPDMSSAGINPEVSAKFTALRLPGAGTTVVWAWSFTGSRELASMDQAVARLHWPDQRS